MKLIHAILFAVCAAACAQQPTEVRVRIEYDGIGGAENVEAIQLSGLTQQSMSGPQEEVTLGLADETPEFELFVRALDADENVVGVSSVTVVPSAGQTITVVASLQFVECDITTACPPGEDCVRGLCINVAADAGPSDAGTDTLFDGGFDARGDASFDAGSDAGFDAGFDAGPPPIGCPPEDGATILLDDFEADVSVRVPTLGATIALDDPRCGLRSMHITGGSEHFHYSTNGTFNSASGSLDFFMKLPAAEGAGTDYIVARDAVGIESNQFSVGLVENQLIIRAQAVVDGKFETAFLCSDVLAEGAWIRVGINWGPEGLEMWTDRELADSTDIVTFDGRTATCGGPPFDSSFSGGNPLMFGAPQLDSEEGGAHTPITPGTSFVGLRIDHVRWSNVRRDYLTQ